MKAGFSFGTGVLVLGFSDVFFILFVAGDWVEALALNCKLTRPALNFYQRTIPVLNMYIWSYFCLSEHNNARSLTVCPSPSNKSKPETKEQPTYK